MLEWNKFALPHWFDLDLAVFLVWMTLCVSESSSSSIGTEPSSIDSNCWEARISLASFRSWISLLSLCSCWEAITASCCLRLRRCCYSSNDSTGCTSPWSLALINPKPWSSWMVFWIISADLACCWSWRICCSIWSNLDILSAMSTFFASSASLSAWIYLFDRLRAAVYFMRLAETPLLTALKW